MKLITPKYILSIFIVFTGTAGALFGILLALPPSTNILLGIILLGAGIITIKLGFKMTKESVPSASKTIVDILNYAELIRKK